MQYLQNNYIFCMQLMKNQNKFASPSTLKPSETILSIKSNLHVKMVKQYSTSQGYFYTKTIDDLIQKKEGDKNCIRTNDIKFDDSKQHMQKYYKGSQSCHQFPELLQYYKYYSQDSICFLNREFSFLATHHDKKKAVLYQQLKKQLNISDSQQTLQEVTGVKQQQRFDNVLSGLQLTLHNDESYLVAEVLKKLVNHYGPSRLKTINKIDSQFKFMTHNLTIGKSKTTIKQGPSLNPQTMLESTNTSVRNCMKQRKEVYKNTTHRRFGSCEVPKSPNMKISTGVGKEKKNRIRRRKSAQLLSLAEININTPSGQQIYRKSSVKTEQHSKNMKIALSQTNFRQKMQQLRKKIRKQKQNLTNKKPQSACVTKKKVKKC